tara:strand:+ start:212 stop:673 length:462 start_codon:yes stop_codon:yes gene_type:complete
MDYQIKLTLHTWVMGGLFLIVVILLSTLFLIVFAKEEEPIQNSAKNTFYSWEAPLYQESEIEARITAYTNRVGETDSTPDITASGQRVREGIVANNCLEFGTMVEIWGERYEVQDRMNSRYGCENFDIFTFDLEEAKRIGSRIANVKIIKLIN